MVKHIEKIGRNAVADVRRATPSDPDEVPGPSPNPATNLIMADIAMRAGTRLMKNAVQKGFLSGRYGRQTASEIVENRSVAQTLASVALAKVATRSLPGALVVGGGMLAKTLFDRRRARRGQAKSTRKGDHELLQQAEE
ncbi:hypothetical protein [Erythrobacter sp. 3-20A1M]|uniref:hypothetical protein n=1 Tax=Erythrobacter sp. 3-20A1M TaxID=2653850 RepID=UPI00203AABE8|nr:hypothetical protein [Erythrobacter sp. 3-20A1M]